ncbi:hypothetical protein [Streptomyces sp. CB00455]|uniref:hypothetical protein n=1 Tax=Streptomyces sp. CB00455 TaxID=1703927 RepID=UPI0009403992|nr:hypothetical protein [Streptomyces sp. CB00455]
MRRRTAFPALLFPALMAALGLTLLAPATAHAHGDTVKVAVTGQRDGHVTADVTWQNDGDAVDEAVAGMANAVSGDGARTLGPWRLVRDPAAAPAGWMTAEVLPPGAWKVTVDVGFPSLGHGTGEVAVPVVDPAPVGSPPAGGAPVPSASAPAPSVPAASPAGPTSGAAPATPPAQAKTPSAQAPDRTVWWTTAGVAAAALAGAAGGVLLRRRRMRRMRAQGTERTSG